MSVLSKLAVATILAASVVSATAHEHYTVAECAEFSQFVWLVARARDNGEVADHVAEVAARSLYAASYIHDSYDTVMSLNAINIVYQQGDLSAEELHDKSLESCLRIMVQHTIAL